MSTDVKRAIEHVELILLAVLALLLPVAARVLVASELVLVLSLSAILWYAVFSLPDWLRARRIAEIETSVGPFDFRLDATPAVFFDSRREIVHLIDLTRRWEPLVLGYDDIKAAGVEVWPGGWSTLLIITKEPGGPPYRALLHLEGDDPERDARDLTCFLYRLMGLDVDEVD
jgi:hypothetical protein